MVRLQHRVASRRARLLSGVLVLPCCRLNAAHGRAARGDRAVHQPGLLVLPAGRQAARRTCARSLRDRAEPCGRLLGLSRLEGHAGAARPYQRGSAPMPRRAATARSTRRRWWSTASRMCSAATRRRSSARSRRRAQAGAHAAAAGQRSVAGDQLTVTVPAAKDDSTARPRSGCARSPSRCRSRSAAARTAATPSPTPTWCGAGSSSANGPARPQTFNVPLKDVQTGDIDAVAVVVQSGAPVRPRLMLGAAQIALQ